MNVLNRFLSRIGLNRRVKHLLNQDRAVVTGPAGQVRREIRGLMFYRHGSHSPALRIKPVEQNVASVLRHGLVKYY